jgi:hypothetical protein
VTPKNKKPTPVTAFAATDALVLAESGFAHTPAMAKEKTAAHVQQAWRFDQRVFSLPDGLNELTILVTPSHKEAVVTGDRRSVVSRKAARSTANAMGRRMRIDSSKRRVKSKPPRHSPACSCTMLSIAIQSAISSDVVRSDGKVEPGGYVRSIGDSP